MEKDIIKLPLSKAQKDLFVYISGKTCSYGYERITNVYSGRFKKTNEKFKIIQTAFHYFDAKDGHEIRYRGRKEDRYFCKCEYVTDLDSEENDF